MNEILCVDRRAEGARGPGSSDLSPSAFISWVEVRDRDACPSPHGLAVKPVRTVLL